MSYLPKQFSAISLSRASRAKGFLLLMFFFGLSLSSATAILSEFRVLDGTGYEGVHEKYKPILKENEKNPMFVDVQIPFIEDDRAYWLVTSAEPLEGTKLNFRSIARGNSLPGHIQAFVRVGESSDHRKTAKRSGVIQFTIHKNLLSRCYVYHDYADVVDDGFYYYTYDLSRHKVESR